MYSTHYSTYQSAPYQTFYYPEQPHTGRQSEPQYYTYDATPQRKSSSKHKRRATMDGAYAYTQPHDSYYYSRDDRPQRTTSQRQPEHVSSSRHRRSKSTRKSKSYAEQEYVPQYRSGDAYYTRASGNSHDNHPGGYADSREDYLSAHDRKYRTSPPPPQTRPTYAYQEPYADKYANRQEPVYFTPESRSHKQHNRSRSYSYETKPTPPPTKPRMSEPAAGPRPANERDARKHGIPAGYSMKHWDPVEDPILLLGSVFDANSLGKWIYDWTVACHGAAAPIAEVAGDLWLLLIQLAGKIRRAEERVKSVRNAEDKDMIEDFLDSGERLWQRFNKLLKVCETYMLKSAKKHSSSKKKVIGKDAGNQFVKCIFGRDRELERTEKIMTGIRLWGVRFDANCVPILRSV